MKEKIEAKDIKVDDYIYIIENLFNERDKNRRFILKILTKKEGLENDTYFWRLENTSQKRSIFDPIEHKDNYTMDKRDWEGHKAYKLSKEEIGKFNKLLIINSL
ncbi:hypothetical protein LCGC14_2602860 [marine sediment metagenome]|uniref:Uncharacterized protein n=1 Tax=marine sediment metagenome TaxID=412755 RepID=A0A0F9A895_9ZZZZ